MTIGSDFIGGNIIVDKIDSDAVYLRCDMRDTSEKWFYWSFCVKNAGGKKVKFIFDSDVIGYFGPAVSYDNYQYSWQFDDTGHQGKSFEYEFAPDENEVYFCHDIAYRPQRFFDFCIKNGLSYLTLCKSEKGNDVPYLALGSGREEIVLTSRHHACESTGTYVLEGVLTELITKKEFLKNYKIICVPFMDYDGVIYGDQGKSRIPHDHNRDYIDEPIYNTVKKIKEFLSAGKVVAGFDFHSPWHIGGEHDNVYIVHPCNKFLEHTQAFGRILQEKITTDSMQYNTKNDKLPNVGWNKEGTPGFLSYAVEKTVANIAFTFETAYFGNATDKFTVKSAIALGICFAKAIEEYLFKQY